MSNKTLKVQSKGSEILKSGFVKRALSVVLSALILFSFYIPSSAAENSGFSYEIISGSTSIRITGFNGSSETVEIPDILDGRTVIEISASAFEGNTTVKSVTISSNVLRIMKDAFKNCSLLQSVVIPASVTSIGDSAFAGCVSLTSVTVSSASTAIGFYAFEGCTSLKSITIPSTKIGYAAFINCTALESVNLLDSVQSVDRFAFSGTAWYANQPEGLHILGSVLYDYNGTEETVTVPSGIRCIANYAFSETNVKNVILPDGLYYIGLYAFYKCPSLQYLSVPESVITIGASAIGYGESGRIENFKIYCYKDSVAMLWSSNNSIDYELIDECQHQFSDWNVLVEPACTSGGEKSRFCIKCNLTENEKLKANGHSWSGWIVLVELSCTSDQLRRRTCTVCGENDDEITVTKGHTWNEWNVLTEPACTEAGKQAHKCTVCGEVEEKPIEPLGHSWIVDDTTDSDGWIVKSEPQCATPGISVRTCSVCAFEDRLETAGPGHKAEEWTVIKDPTSVTVGIKQGICTVCGEKFTADIPVLNEQLPDDVKMLTMQDDAVIKFSENRAYIYGIPPETKVNDVLVQFNYPAHILVTDGNVANQLSGDDFMTTGCHLILVKENPDTNKYEPIDTVSVIVTGDIDSNGAATAADARLALRYSALLEELSDFAVLSADVDADGKVTAADARLILRVSSKLEVF